MTNLEKLEHWAVEHGQSVIIELNDYENGNLSFEEEINDLVADDDIDEDVAQNMQNSRTIWSVRFEVKRLTGNRVTVFYSWSLAHAVSLMVEHLGL